MMKNKTVTFSIPEFLYEEFVSYCKENNLITNMSFECWSSPSTSFII
jgi:hypothetical protein